MLKTIRDMNKSHFDLQDLYAQRALFSAVYPENKHVEAKIRQQLQVLRDLEVIRFEQRGRYHIVAPNVGSSPPDAYS